MLGLVGSTRSAWSQTVRSALPAKRACDAVLARADAQMRRAAHIGPRVAIGSFNAHNGCHIAGTSAWLLLVDRPQLRRAGGVVDLRDGTLTITYFAPNGTSLRVDPALLGEHTRVLERGASHAVQPADFDADGVDELVLFAPPSGRPRTTVLTVRDGAVRAYGGTVPLDFDVLSSTTMSPQLDMVQHIKHTLPEACDTSLGRTRTVMSFLAVHSGATFRADGDEARAWARAQCPERPAVIVPQHGVTPQNASQVWNEVLRRTACARVWGMSADAIARVIPTRWPAALSCTNAAELVSWVRSMQPPLTLQPMPEVRPSPASAEANVLFADLDEWTRDIDAADYVPPIRAFAAAQSRRLDASLNQLVRQAQGSLSIDELQEFFSPFGRAVPGTGREAWFNTAVRLRVDNASEELLVTGTSRIVHVNASGQLALDQPDMLERRYESSTLRYVTNAYDYDGDGSSEAFARLSEFENESAGSTEISLMTVRGGVVRPYDPIGGVPAFDRVIDVDDDGRPDLVSTNKYSVSLDSDSEPRGSILTVAHSRPDGTFSTDDARARAFIESQCTAPPERIVVPSSDDDDEIDATATLGAVVCARYYGERAESIVARIHADARNLDETQRSNLRTIAEAAVWRMPFVLAARPRATQRP